VLPAGIFDAGPTAPDTASQNTLPRHWSQSIVGTREVRDPR